MTSLESSAATDGFAVSRTSPRVTVLMCVYNDELHVAAAIESILAQSYTDFELLIIDDGSTDRTPQILRSYAAADSRIRVFSQANVGTTKSANRGLELARGEYVARLDSDDISLPHRLGVEVDFLDRHPEVGLVGGGSYLIDAGGHIVGRRNICPRNPALALRSRCIYQQSDVMFRRDVVRSVGGYRSKFHNAQDYDLWLRISEKVKIAKLPDMLGLWRINPGGYTLARAAEQRYESRVVRRLARERRSSGKDSYELATPTPPSLHRKSISEEAYLVWLGSVMVQDGRRSEARATLTRAHRLRPSPRTRLGLLLTFAPTAVIRTVVRCRDAYLNYRYAW